MEHILVTHLQIHIKKLKELEEQGQKLCADHEIVMNDIIRLRIALKLHLGNLKTDFSSYSNTTNLNEELVNTCIVMQSKAEEVLINIETLLEVSVKTQSTMKLPVLNLPKFKGDITEFSEFWDRFDSAIGLRDLQNVEKLAYLINCLEGPALEVVKGLSTTNENYKIALDMLRIRYGSKNKLIDAHYEALNKLKKATNTAAECRFLLNSIQRHLRILSSLGENTEGNHIRVLLLGKFPEKVLYELNVLKGPDCSSQEILHGLERIVTAMECARKPDMERIESEHKPGCSTEALHIKIAKKKPWLGRTERPYLRLKTGNSHIGVKEKGNYEENGNSSKSRKRKQEPTMVVKYAGKKRRKSCVFCDGDHYNDRCDLVKSIEERNGSNLELHCFADASKDAYAAVIYLRVTNEKQIKTAFLMAKSRVTPLEGKDALKIPKLELLGCLIGCRLLKYVRNSLALPIEKQYLWTDSLIVLSWMRSNKLLPPFVAKRIDEIKQHKEVQPYYINTNENPADLATRPDVWLMKKELWFNGPEFLLQDETNWPVTRSLDYHRSLLVAGEGQDHHPEEVIVDDHHEKMIVDEQYNEETHDDIDLAMEEEKEEERKSEQLAEIKRIQQEYFPDEMKGKETHLTRNLGLFLDIDGIIRCKGRMSNTCWTYDMKHPILLPKDSQFTNTLIMTTHTKNYHVGTAHTLSLIRQQYWIPHGRAQVKKIIMKCPQCQKHTSGPYKLPTPPSLPPERVNYSSPFTYTGVDYLGPIFVSTEIDKAKRWICLFTCLVVRAVHLEVVEDLTAEECLMAFRRFISCRGVPKVVVSDNGTQFKLTSEVLSNSYCIENKITWRFIPQLAPWHGGFYERLVGLVKNCLKRTLEKHMLKDTQLVTVVKEVEAVVNTRPLTNVGSEMETVVRPSDFLTIGKCLVTEMSENDFSQDVTTTKRNLVEGWRKGQIILEEFKKMFVNQYLLSLRERYNHSHKQPRITSSRLPCIGDIVQIKGDSKNRSNWKIGKIVELINGPDGQCRVAKVKIDDTIFTRSIGHLYPLEIENDKSCDVTEENEPLCADVPSVGNVTENEPPVVVQLPENVPCEHLPEIPSNEIHSLEKETVESEELPTQNEEEGDQSLTESEIEDPANTSESVPQPENGRVRRDAAVRAREKIAEWTRHLVALL